MAKDAKPDELDPVNTGGRRAERFLDGGHGMKP